MLWPNILDQSPFCPNPGHGASTGNRTGKSFKILSNSLSLKGAVKKGTWKSTVLMSGLQTHRQSQHTATDCSPYKLCSQEKKSECNPNIY